MTILCQSRIIIVRQWKVPAINTRPITRWLQCLKLSSQRSLLQYCTASRGTTIFMETPLMPVCIQCKAPAGMTNRNTIIPCSQGEARRIHIQDINSHWIRVERPQCRDSSRIPYLFSQIATSAKCAPNLPCNPIAWSNNNSRKLWIHRSTSCRQSIA